MSWQTPVFSSNVAEVGYDSDSNELLITWAKGRISAYKDVPEELAVQLSKAPSVGQMLNSEIKPNYQHRYIR